MRGAQEADQLMRAAGAPRGADEHARAAKDKMERQPSQKEDGDREKRLCRKP